MTTLWVVRAGTGGVSVERFLDGGYIEIGFWAEKLGTWAKGMSREQLAEELRRLLPNEKKGQHINSAGQLFRFHEEIAVGDEVITYDPTRRRYLLGQIAGGVEFVAKNDEHARFHTDPLQAKRRSRCRPSCASRRDRRTSTVQVHGGDRRLPSGHSWARPSRQRDGGALERVRR